jgi:hypothetical protein
VGFFLYLLRKKQYRWLVLKKLINVEVLFWNLEISQAKKGELGLIGCAD